MFLTDDESWPPPNLALTTDDCQHHAILTLRGQLGRHQIDFLIEQFSLAGCAAYHRESCLAEQLPNLMLEAAAFGRGAHAAFFPTEPS